MGISVYMERLFKCSDLDEVGALANEIRHDPGINGDEYATLLILSSVKIADIGRPPINPMEETNLQK